MSDRYCENCSEHSATAFDGACVHWWAQEARTIRDPNDGQTTMRMMLSKCVQEAVKLAIVDCVGSDQTDQLRKDFPQDTWAETFEKADEIRSSWLQDIYQVPNELFSRIDPGALANNTACRLIGYGGVEPQRGVRWERNGE